MVRVGSPHISIDISLYPLADDKYEDANWDFIERLHQHNDIKVETNGMSTQVFGDYDAVVEKVMAEIKHTHQQVGTAIFVCKFVPSDRSDFVSKF